MAETAAYWTGTLECMVLHWIWYGVTLYFWGYYWIFGLTETASTILLFFTMALSLEAIQLSQFVQMSINKQQRTLDMSLTKS